MISFANLLYVLLIHLIELLISPGFSYELINVVYEQREKKSQYLLNCNYIWSTHFQERKWKNIIKRQFCLRFSLLYLLIRSCKFIISRNTRIRHSTRWGRDEFINYSRSSLWKCFIKNSVLKNFWNFLGKQKTEILTQMFSCEYCDTFKNTNL